MMLTRFRYFFICLWVNHFCLICVHLLLVYHSAQLSHTWSDFSRSLRVMISETRILFHFILVLLSSTMMKQLTCNVGIIFLIHIFGLDWWRDLFQVTESDVSCVLCIICSQVITFEQVTLCSAYCAWFVAFLASPYVILLRTCPYLVLGQFDSTVYIRVPTSEFSLSCADLCKVSTEDSDHVIS